MGILEMSKLIASVESGRKYDSFREWLIIPIQDEVGQVVAFVGRLLDPEAKAQSRRSQRAISHDFDGRNNSLSGIPSELSGVIPIDQVAFDGHAKVADFNNVHSGFLTPDRCLIFERSRATAKFFGVEADPHTRLSFDLDVGQSVERSQEDQDEAVIVQRQQEGKLRNLFQEFIREPVEGRMPEGGRFLRLKFLVKGEGDGTAELAQEPCIDGRDLAEPTEKHHKTAEIRVVNFGARELKLDLTRMIIHPSQIGIGRFPAGADYARIGKWKFPICSPSKPTWQIARII